MRDSLPLKTKINECGILNLDLKENSGTHWVCYSKNKNICFYFDSFGVQPPLEFESYMKNCDIIYSTMQVQKLNSFNCGHLCLEVLYRLQKEKFENIIFNLFFHYK